MDNRAEVFTALYDRHYPKVLAYARACGAWQAAEDIAAETFIVAWRRLPDLPSEPLPWMLRVAATLVRNHRRADGRRDALAIRLDALPKATESDVASQVAEQLAVQRALASLSQRDRDTLTLVAWLDLTPAQAAEVMGCSPATFTVRLHRAKRRLARALRSGASELTSSDGTDLAPAVPTQPTTNPGTSRAVPVDEVAAQPGTPPDAIQTSRAAPTLQRPRSAHVHADTKRSR